MTKYVALLRGFSPLNPNMRNENLCEVFKDLGFKSVKTVISSGNVIFKTSSGNVEELKLPLKKPCNRSLALKLPSSGAKMN